MARIVQQGVITTSGTSYENEPIIKSDGAGEVMQWKPSDDGADGIFITESVVGEGLNLGVGVSPEIWVDSRTALQVGGNGALNASMAAGAGGNCEMTYNAYINSGGNWSAISTGVATMYRQAGGEHKFLTAASTSADAAFVGGTAFTERLTIGLGGAVTIPATGSFTIGSLDIGHGAGNGGTADINSTAVGTGALDGSLNTSTNNTAIGAYALTATMTNVADHNTGVGYNGLAAITSGKENTAVGSQAADSLSTGNYNVAIGRSALTAATTSANDNTAVGNSALAAFTGSNATAVGSGAADSATSAAYLTAVGATALGNLVTEDYCTAVGYGAGQNSINASNTFVGNAAGQYLGDATHVVALGREALRGAYHDKTCVTSSSTSVAFAAGTTDIAIGQVVTGSGIPAGTKVSAVNASPVTEFTITNAATSGITTSLRFYKNQGDYNVAVGNYTLDAITTGYANIAIGHTALSAATNNIHNVAIGHEALDAASADEHYNVAIGSYALSSDTASSGNVAIGYQALEDQNRAASANTAIGYQALTNLGSGVDFGGIQNTVVGYQAGGSGVFGGTADGGSNEKGSANTLLGYQAGKVITTGKNNLIAGAGAGIALTTGLSNVLIGHNAGNSLTDNEGNIAIGQAALDGCNGGEEKNIAIGHYALSGDIAGADYCVAIGASALLNQNADVKNTVIGGLAGDAIEGGDRNTLLGYLSGSDLTGGDDNVCIGHMTMVNATGSQNVVIGSTAGSSNSNSTATQFSGSNNILVGAAAGLDLTDGSESVLIGTSAGANITTGLRNIAIGYNALDAAATGANDNVAIGHSALTAAPNGTERCIAIGTNTLAAQNDTGINLAIGKDAGLVVTSGTANVLIGHEAGSALADDNYNTALGYNALLTAQSDNNTAMGYLAAKLVATGSDNTVLGAYALVSADGGEADNTALGRSALANIDSDTADHNVAVGRDAGRWDAAGVNDGTDGIEGATNSIYIGSGSRGSGTATTSIDNEIVIGQGAIGHGNGTLRLGNTGITQINAGTGTITADSDRRIKRDITDCDSGLVFIENLRPINFKSVNPADYPVEILEARFKEGTNKELATPAVEAADEVWEDAIVQEARDATEEETRDEVHAAVEEVRELRVTQEACDEEWEETVHPAEEAVYEDRVTQEAREEIKGERHKHDEKTVSEDVTTVDFVKNEAGDYVRTETTETVTRTERTPLYTDHEVVNPDGTPCVDSSGEPVIHKCPVMEEYVVQEACDEVTERVCTREAVEERTERQLMREAQVEVKEEVVVVEAKAEWTETHITRPAEPAREEVTERRLVSAAVEAKDAVYETVTVPADDRPADDDTVRLGLIAQDVQTAMTEAGVEFDLVNESPNGKLSLKYGNLVMPLIKAVQELSARVKTLEG